MTRTSGLAERSAAARAWRQAGGKVVGYFADDVPTALIEAAGFLPFRIFGDPDGGQPRAMARGPVDVRADRFEVANSWVHLIASHAYDFVDHFIVSNSRKYVLQLNERLRALETPPSIHILDRASGDSPEAAAFNARAVEKLRAGLEGWAGKAIDDADLIAAIALYDGRAALLTQLAELRREAQISGIEALRALHAIRTMRSEDAMTLLVELTASAAPLSGTRLFVSGSPLDNDRLYVAAEESGAIIVGESHNWGPRLLESPIGTGDPWKAIARHYHRSAEFIVPLPHAVKTAAERCAASGAQAVLTHLLEYDDAALWEAPSEREAFALPSVTLAEQPYRTDPAAVRTAVSRLIAEPVA